MNLIIPSAKIVGEELQRLGKLPAVIYPVNDDIVFDYLYNQYKECVDSFKVLCYEKAEKVHRRLSAYKTTTIDVIDLQYLGDLGETIYQGLDEVEGSVIINFGDTIVLEEMSYLEDDSFYYSVDFKSSIWTFFDIDNGCITNIYDKSPQNSDIANTSKLFVGVFKFSDAIFLKDCLEYALNNRSCEMNSFYQAIQRYSKKKKLKGIYTDNWFDIGHADKYYNSTLEVKAREFNHITIDKNRGILKKTSDDVDKFIGEIKWYLKLPSDVEYVRPRIFDYSTSYTEPYVSMEYYAYHTLHELFLYGDLTKKQWQDIFSRISFVCKDFKKHSIRDGAIRESLDDMYLGKTIQRLDQMKKSDYFRNFFDREITVNGRKYKSLEKIISILKTIVPKELFELDEFNIIHGDLCFANIMVDSNFTFIKVVDPRGKFGRFDIYGDPRYELAKLFHSVDGKYDYIIKDLFNLSFDEEECTINYEIQDRNREYNLYQVFLDSFSDDIANNIKKIELIESLLFISMIPLHRESLNHQMVMLGTGLDILNRVFPITED